MPQQAVSTRLYLISPPLGGRAIAAFPDLLRSALSSGADVASLLVRFETGAPGDLKNALREIAAVAEIHDIAVLVQDDPRLAVRADVDGVHLSAPSEALAEAVKSLKPRRIVGVGGLRGRDAAMAAGEQGADYLMFGIPDSAGAAAPLSAVLDLVEWWSDIFEPPCVGYASALEEVAEIAAAGAEFVALEAAVWGASSPAEALAQAQVALDALRS